MSMHSIRRSLVRVVRRASTPTALGAVPLLVPPCRCGRSPYSTSTAALTDAPIPLDDGAHFPLQGDDMQPWTRAERRRKAKLAVDLRLPHEMYPAARAVRRTVHAHLGPTNSGKTHAAIEALRAAESGVYCGPLRLLAWEIHDRLGSLGVPCTLRTGQETREVVGAQHTSCTIEMCALHEPLDVGVLDEIQMLSHPERGWAWSRALLGLPARELHVCGSADALPLLRTLVERCGDKLVLHEYERLTPLDVSEGSLRGDLRRVEAGDCVVAFSRREIFQLKQQVEVDTGLKCGVIYGSLPPETRREQARQHRKPTPPLPFPSHPFQTSLRRS